MLTTDHAFGGLVTLNFELDGKKKQMQATLVDVEWVFNMGDEKYKENFTICQSGTQQEIDVSKYYLDRCPMDCTLQDYMTVPQYIDPPEEPKSIEIGDLIGKGGLVL
ncbi:hypothetical protein P692DRAFT_20872472 [Suillus brevipes Sb2]|nr:hypothetical protein P692DRAFT_20872472 [Suillus brevipes Sb2]